jgi:hypothetical protein
MKETILMDGLDDDVENELQGDFFYKIRRLGNEWEDRNRRNQP